MKGPDSVSAQLNQAVMINWNLSEYFRNYEVSGFLKKIFSSQILNSLNSETFVCRVEKLVGTLYISLINTLKCLFM